MTGEVNLPLVVSIATVAVPLVWKASALVTEFRSLQEDIKDANERLEALESLNGDMQRRPRD